MITDDELKTTHNFDHLKYAESHLMNALELIREGDIELCKTSIRLATTNINEYEGTTK